MAYELLDQRAEDIRDRLVQCAGFAPIDKICLVLRDAMGQFVTDDVDRLRKTLELLVITVTIDHSLAVPKRVVIVDAIVHGSMKGHTAIVDRVSPKHFPVE